MKTTFRFPGSAEYSYAELETTPGSVPDNARELRDIDSAFLSLVGNVLAQGCGLVALGPLGPQVVADNDPHYLMTTPDGAVTPPWASQEAQGYSGSPQQAYAPQNGSQGYQGYQQPQQYAAPAAPPSPPGQQVPMCQMHGQPATFKPGGVSKASGKPYDAFWACSANNRDCTRASNFPRP